MTPRQIPAARPLDHLVLASRDLAAQARLYERLGFRVGARNRHAWGTENHIVQFDRHFLELVGLGEGFDAALVPQDAAPFGGFLAAYLSRAEGLAMLVLQSGDAAADQAAFTAAGISAGAPLHFGRKAVRPDGSGADVSFSLAFARSPLIADAGFFTCQHHHPENFYKPEFQRHPNGAVGVAGVVMVAENPSDHAEFFSGFTHQREMTVTSMGLEISIGAARIEVLTPVAYTFRTGLAAPAPALSPAFAAYRVKVADLARTAALLQAGGVPCETLGKTQGAGLVLGPVAAGGAALIFQS